MYRNDISEKLLPVFDSIAKGEVAKAENLVRPMLNEGDALALNQAKFLFAVCKFRNAEFDNALKSLQEIDPWENKEALGLSAICLVKLNRINDAEARFDRALTLEKGAHGYLTCEVILNYLNALIEVGELTKIKKYVDLFLDVYASYGITDPTFLIIRETPPFEEFINVIKKAVQRGYADLIERDWQNLYLKVDGEGQNALKTIFSLTGWNIPNRQ